LFVELEEVFDAGLVVGERFGAVEAVDGAVEGLVGLEEFGRHEQRVVERGEGGVGEKGPGVKDGLCEGLDLRALGVSGFGGPREVVVDDVFQNPTPYPS
jgi:hypothetical protein